MVRVRRLCVHAGRSTRRRPGTSNEVNNASIAFVDEDGSALSKELFNAFYPPRFQRPRADPAGEVEDAMDRGRFMFVVVDPAPVRARPSRRAASRPPGEHRRDRHAAGRHRRRLHQEHHQRAHRDVPATRTDREARRRRSSWSCASCSTRTAISSWFTSVVAIINQLTLLTVVLTGRRGDPRARARDARAPAGDAAHARSRSRWPRCGPTGW